MMKLAGLFEKYLEHLESIKFPIHGMVWVGIALVALAAIFGFSALLFFAGTISIDFFILGIVSGVAVADLMIALPFIRSLSRIDSIEENLPEVLKQMADTLKAGGTYEYTLREVAEAGYGPLKKEIDNVLRKLEEGENFENSLRGLAENVDSRIVKRTITIIIDSVRAGAGLADILEQISEDVKALHRLSRERKARTMMQVIFIAVAGATVAPMILGFVSTIVTFLINTAGGVATPEQLASAMSALFLINLGIQGYIIIISFFAAVMIALMRVGKLGKTFIYFPILLFIAYSIYLLTKIFSAAWLGVA